MSKMDMNVTKGMPTLKQDIGVVTRGRKRTLAQINDVKSGGDQDTALLTAPGARVCQCCQGEVSATQHNLCSNSHLLCDSCLKVAIRTSISTDQTLLTCLVRSCQAEITLDESESPFCVTLFRAHVQSILSKAGKPVNGTKETPQKTEVVSCPSCKTTAELTAVMAIIKCSNASCKQMSCRFCREEFTPQTLRKHGACALLKFPGFSCWTDLSKLPANWSKYEDDEYKKSGGFIRVMVPLKSEEGSSVVKFYGLSSRRTVREVWRIQNPHLWQRYALMKKNMLKELAVEDLNETPLFHGTSQRNKPNILTEGFDCRKARPLGSCGQGTYFSQTARFSENYSDDQELFIAFVLCGKSTTSRADQGYPDCDEHGRPYDSVVDYNVAPSMYVVFCSSQCYPAYLVKAGRADPLPTLSS